MCEWRLPAKDDTIPCREVGVGRGGGKGRGRYAGSRGEGASRGRQGKGEGCGEDMAKLGMTRSLVNVATHTRGQTRKQAW